MGSMKRSIILCMVLAVASLATLFTSMGAQAQSGEDGSAASLKTRQVPGPVQPRPFSADRETPAQVAPIEYRSANQMTEKDRMLEADAESSISEHAGYVGLEFNQGQWSYRQVVCPALPNHMFLRFQRNNGTGDVSVFTASIPRNGEGRVRIIPIQLRGYSLWSPAPINALTISAFNHIRAEENADDAQDWLGSGFCYAALAGGHPVAGKLTDDPESQKIPAAIPAVLRIPVHDGEQVSFTDVSAAPRLMQWTMIFSGKGRLMRAKHAPVGLLKEGAVPPAGKLEGRPVPR